MLLELARELLELELELVAMLLLLLLQLKVVGSKLLLRVAIDVNDCAGQSPKHSTASNLP